MNFVSFVVATKRIYFSVDDLPRLRQTLILKLEQNRDPKENWVLGVSNNKDLLRTSVISAVNIGCLSASCY